MFRPCFQRFSKIKKIVFNCFLKKPSAVMDVTRWWILRIMCSPEFSSRCSYVVVSRGARGGSSSRNYRREMSLFRKSRFRGGGGFGSNLISETIGNQVFSLQLLSQIASFCSRRFSWERTAKNCSLYILRMFVLENDSDRSRRWHEINDRSWRWQ